MNWQNDYKEKIVLESLASFAEHEYCASKEQNHNVYRARREELEREWKEWDISVWPYSGAYYIFIKNLNRDFFNQVFETSLDDMDAAYELLIPEDVRNRLDQNPPEYRHQTAREANEHSRKVSIKRTDERTGRINAGITVSEDTRTITVKTQVSKDTIDSIFNAINSIKKDFADDEKLQFGEWRINDSDRAGRATRRYREHDLNAFRNLVNYIAGIAGFVYYQSDSETKDEMNVDEEQDYESEKAHNGFNRGEKISIRVHPSTWTIRSNPGGELYEVDLFNNTVSVNGLTVKLTRGQLQTICYLTDDFFINGVHQNRAFDASCVDVSDSRHGGRSVQYVSFSDELRRLIDYIKSVV